MQVPNDASLYFSGSAYDEADRVLRGKALRWKAGRKTIGRGESISVADLPLGTRKIVLEAKDRLGRVGRASVPVRLKAVAPRILTLKAPRKASGRSVALKLSVSLTSRLTVTGGARKVRAQVGRRARTVRVRLRGGKTPVRLKLEVAAAGKSSAVRVQIRR